ncbi:molybdenum ABC transporter ATP-binding protein [Clostridium difficile BI1] [Clostridioides difficile]|nr:molybdenum ABC transporter ATP-binding protein [Clostridium difficile BI1] [Clostridioides difficile]
MKRDKRKVEENGGGGEELNYFFFLMRRRPPRSTQSRSSAASDVYKRQGDILFVTHDIEEAYRVCDDIIVYNNCLLYTSPSPRDRQKSRMPSSA